MTEVDMRIGENLRRFRKMRGLGQMALSERSGVPQQTISGIERGHRGPHPATLEKLADALGVAVGALFEEADAPPKAPHVALAEEEFDELRRAANAGDMDGAAFLRRIQREYDAVDAHYRTLLERDAGEGEIEMALGLLIEARRRWRVVMFDRVEETAALDERRDPTAPERDDTRFLSLEEADAQIRAARQAKPAQA